MPKLFTNVQSPDFRYDTPWENGLAFHEAMNNKPAALIFLRYLGCPICQYDLASFRQGIDLFQKKGANLFFVLQSKPQIVAQWTEKKDWPFTIICDPEGIIFRQYSVEAGGIIRYLHPAGFLAAIRAMMKGYKHGKFEGRETQLPAAFIVGENKIIKFAHYGKNISDIPPPAKLAKYI